MRMNIGQGALILALLLPTCLFAQKGQREEDFVRAKPTIGDSLPEVTIYSSDGKEFKTSSLCGHYTVLTFGCLT